MHDRERTPDSKQRDSLILHPPGRRGRASARVRLLIGVAALSGACGGDDAVEPQPEPPTNRAPVVAVVIPDQMLIEGQMATANIAGAFSDPDGDALTYSVTSSNPAVASLTASGTELSVTGVAAGAAAITVTATDPGGLSASQGFAVEVAAATPTQLAVSPGTATLTAVGRTVQLSAEVLDQLGRPMSGVSVGWSSGEPAVATVDANGLVTAAGNGEATITATAGDASGTAVITVRQSAHSVAVTPTFDTLTALGDTTRLVAVVRDEDGHVVPDAEVTWSTRHTQVATVDGDGLVTAVGNGRATISVAAGAAAATALVYVDQTASSVSVSPAADTLTALGDTVRLTAAALDANNHAVADAEFTWSSADGGVVTVDTDGLVTAVGNGSADVRATSDGASGSASLVVAQRTAAVEVLPEMATLAPGDTVRLAATATDANGHAVAGAAFTWTSSDSTVASVDDAGLVEALAEGMARITAASGGADDEAVITVSSPQPPPDLTGYYGLESIIGAATGGLQLTRPAVSGALELEQRAPVGTAAMGRYGVRVTTPASDIADRGTYTAHGDGRWEQTGAVSGEGTYAVSGDTLTIVIAEPATASSTTVWVRDTVPPGTWRGLVVAPENRCSQYDPDDYRHPEALAVEIIEQYGDRIYTPYTGIYYEDYLEVSVDHVVAKTEVHDSGGCRWNRTERRAFVRDLVNLTLASPRLDRGVKAEQDAAEWLPDFNRCWFAGAVVAVRRKYELTVDEAERDALEAILSECESTEMVFAPESWTIERMKLGEESGWQVVSRHEPDVDGFGIVSRMAVFCTATYASVDFEFISGGAQLEGGAGFGARHTTLVPAQWTVTPLRPVDQVGMHQFPPWGVWTARIDGEQRIDFLVALSLERQAVSIEWPLPGNFATVIYRGGTDAHEKIFEILQYCNGGPADLPALLSRLSHDPTAIRERP